MKPIPLITPDFPTSDPVGFQDFEELETIHAAAADLATSTSPEEQAALEKEAGMEIRAFEMAVADLCARGFTPDGRKFLTANLGAIAPKLAEANALVAYLREMEKIGRAA